jgi:hypothetical protein
MAGRAVTPPWRNGKAVINHVWMTRMDDELYSGLDDPYGEQGLDVLRLGSAEPGEEVEGLT